MRILLLAIGLCAGPTGLALAREAPPVAPVDTLQIITAVDHPDSAVAVEVAPPDSTRSVDGADTVYTASASNPLQFDVIKVSARRVSRVAGADRVELDQELIDTRDGGSVSDLVSLLPSTKLTVNSRGESLFMVRGSNERHLRVELDGIPLSIPWDERVDLSMLPLLAIGSIEARRGVTSVLEEPNTLAGTVEMHTREQVLDGSASQVGAWAGEANAWGVQGLHQRRHGDWRTLVAAEYRERAAFLVPADEDPGLHQDPDRRARLNSDLEQAAALARVQRDFGDEGRWHLLVQGSKGDKGVPPEEHVMDARFWRYPEMQRLLVGARVETPMGSQWDLDGSASADFFSQEIDDYPDDLYITPTGYEDSRDRTGFGRLRVNRKLGANSDLRMRVTGRYSEHREETDAMPDELMYSQLLSGAAAELEHRWAQGITVRGGVGYEGATTPDTGDKPSRDADHEFAAQAAVEGSFQTDGRWHVNGSHRPRMPSMRELYSGALGTFVPNEDLKPEIQDAIEAGMSWSASRWNLSVNGFAQQIDGAIERITLPGGMRQRVNLDKVRNLGIEVGSVVKPVRGISLDFQGTWLYSRSRGADGDYDQYVEDRPDWLATLAGTWTHRSGVQFRAELDGVGARHSLDERKTDPADPFTELDAFARLNLRLSWRHFGELGGYSGSEFYVRLDNVLDTVGYSQVGLVESGRMLQAGIRMDFDR